MRRRLALLGLTPLLAATAAVVVVVRHRRDAPVGQGTPPQDARPVAEGDFLKPGRALVFGAWPTRPPVSAYWLHYRGRYYSLDTPNDLVGHVEIRSPQQALAYARIADRGDDASDGWWELLAPGTAEAAYGRPLTRQQWEANRLSPPSATPSGDRFVVRRWAYRRQVGEVKTICLLSETVSRDGSIRPWVMEEKGLVGMSIYIGGLQ